MTAAHPLPPAHAADDLEVFPMDDAYMATLPADVRAAMEAAEERIANGTARIVWEEDVPATLAEIRRTTVG
jgi:hypothetical protein